MKQTITLVLLTVLSLPAEAQIFNQKATQKKYLIEQIAALKIYGEYLQKGYQVVKDGTRLISDIKEGDFDIHKEYFESLERVNPALLNLDKVKATLTIQQTMMETRQALLSMARVSDLLSPKERTALNVMLSELTDASRKDIDELMLILTDSSLGLKDDERLQKIDGLYSATKSKYASQLKLYLSIQSLIKGRKNEKLFIENLKQLYDK